MPQKWSANMYWIIFQISGGITLIFLWFPSSFYFSTGFMRWNPYATRNCFGTAVAFTCYRLCRICSIWKTPASSMRWAILLEHCCWQWWSFWNSTSKSNPMRFYSSAKTKCFMWILASCCFTLVHCHFSLLMRIFINTQLQFGQPIIVFFWYPSTFCIYFLQPYSYGENRIHNYDCRF